MDLYQSLACCHSEPIAERNPRNATELTTSQWVSAAFVNHPVMRHPKPVNIVDSSVRRRTQPNAVNECCDFTIVSPADDGSVTRR